MGRKCLQETPQSSAEEIQHFLFYSADITISIMTIILGTRLLHA